MSVAYLDRPIYGMAQVDSLLGLRSGTAARWIDGYVRGGKHYPPVVREASTGDDLVTWGEFVETRLLAGYRNEGVPMLRMRPVVENLRTTFGVRYPLAHAKPYVDAGRQLVYQVQENVGLEESMRLVVEASSNQLLLAHPTREFFTSAEFDVMDDKSSESVVTRLRPLGPGRSVVIDPDRSFGLPSVRSVATEVLAELIRAGDPIEMVAGLYDLTVDQVLDALEYEKREKVAQSVVTTGGYRFFADENILGVGKALAMLRRDVLHPGHPALPEVPLGSPDSVWIPLVAARGLVAFSRDKRMRTRPAERAAIAAAGLRGVWIADKRDLSNWDLMVRLTRYWNDIEHAVVVHPAGPWLGSLTTRGLRIQFP